MRSAGIAAGVAVILFGLSLLFIVIPDQITDRSGFFFTPRQWPQLLSLLLVACGAFIVWEEVRALGGNENATKERHEAAESVERTLDGSSQWFPLIRVAAVPTLVLLYAWSIEDVGYLASTVLALAVFLVLFGVRRISIIFVMALVFPLAMWLFFHYFLGVKLPSGNWLTFW